jgi:flavin-dependent dehydrogenase
MTKSEIRNPKSEILIAGAGPAGASLAIRLAEQNFRVCLIERDKFPRHKLCGEFISPECLRHFRDLGVLDSMLAAGGERIVETVFYAASGKNVRVPSAWFGGARDALSLSRAEMDFRLTEKAKAVGVEFLEETQIVGVLCGDEKVCGVKAKNKSGEIFEIAADLFVDATGRANVLGKLAEKEISRKGAKAQRKTKEHIIQNPKSKTQNRLVGFKAHLENAALEKNRCEIYFFPGGYGGLSPVENNLANHCFLIKAETVKKFGGNADEIVERVIFQNERARATLKNAAPVLDWLAVSVDGFGVKNLNPAENLFSVGDAAAFIDPFTGSGMLMALESAEILADCIGRYCSVPEQIAGSYQILHYNKFRRRLRVCAFLRRAAFVPSFAGFAISALSLSRAAQMVLARATRPKISGFS